MVEVKRTIKVTTEQRIIEKPSDVEGYPMRAWTVRIHLVDENGKDIPASLFEKATYKLHPSFKTPVHTIRNPPFEIREEGWGEFEMEIILTAVEKGGDYSIMHDLNFKSESYEGKHILSFKNPKPAFMAVLRENGPVPGDENGINGKHKKNGPGKDDETSRKRKRGAGQAVDLEKLADGLQRLSEDELLHVVSLINDNKTPETYVKTDTEQGEFHVDLYTLPESLVRMLWDYTSSKVDLS